MKPISFLLSSLLLLLYSPSWAHSSQLPPPPNCAQLLASHLQQDEGFLPWRSLSETMGRLESATLLIRIPLDELNLSVQDLTDLKIPSHLRITVLPQLTSLVRGAAYHVIKGPSQELSQIQSRLQTRYNPAKIDFQLLETTARTQIFQLPAPSRLIELQQNAEADPLEDLLSKEPRLAVFDSSTGVMTFVVPRAELAFVSGARLKHLGISTKSLPSQTSISDWIRTSTSDFRESFIGITPHFFLISKRAFVALKRLENRQLNRAEDLPIVRMQEDFEQGLAREFARCSTSLCATPFALESPDLSIQELNHELTAILSKNRDELLLREIKNGLLEKMISAWTKAGGVTKSRPDAVREGAQNIAAQILTKDEASTFLRELDRIGPQRSDFIMIGQLMGGHYSGVSALHRFIDLWKGLAQLLNPQSPNENLTAPSIQRTILHLEERSNARKDRLSKPQTASVKNPKPTSAARELVVADPSEVLRIKSSDLTAKQAYEQLFPPSPKALSSSSPLAFILSYSSPAWVVLDITYASHSPTPEILSRIETSSSMTLSLDAQKELSRFQKFGPEKILAVPVTRLKYGPGGQLLQHLLSTQSLVIVTHEDHQVLLLPLTQKRSDLPLGQTPPRTSDEIVSRPKSSEKMATAAISEAEPRRPILHFSDTAQEDHFIGDRQDFENFVQHHEHDAIRSTTDPNSWELAYYRHPNEGLIYFEFNKSWSAKNQADVIEITHMRVLNAKQQREFWRKMAVARGIESTIFEFNKGQGIWISKGSASGIYISGAVLLKILIKHRLDEKLIEHILNRVHSPTRIESGDYYTKIVFEGKTYEIFFAIQSDYIALKTIYEKE